MPPQYTLDASLASLLTAKILELEVMCDDLIAIVNSYVTQRHFPVTSEEQEISDDLGDILA